MLKYMYFDSQIKLLFNIVIIILIIVIVIIISRDSTSSSTVGEYFGFALL